MKQAVLTIRLIQAKKIRRAAQPTGAQLRARALFSSKYDQESGVSTKTRAQSSDKGMKKSITQQVGCGGCRCDDPPRQEWNAIGRTVPRAADAGVVLSIATCCGTINFIVGIEALNLFVASVLANEATDFRSRSFRPFSCRRGGKDPREEAPMNVRSCPTRQRDARQ
jgi:hypothetical protein